jgi:hypothetical protein
MGGRDVQTRLVVAIDRPARSPTAFCLLREFDARTNSAWYVPDRSISGPRHTQQGSAFMVGRTRIGQFTMAVAVALLALAGCSTDKPAEGDSVSTTSARPSPTSSNSPPSSTSPSEATTTSQVIPPTAVPEVVVPPPITPVYIPPPAPAPPPPVAAPVPAPEPTRSAPSVFYKNCTAVRAANADPIYAGDPGYSSDLDRDGDGVACE